MVRVATFDFAVAMDGEREPYHEARIDGRLLAEVPFAGGQHLGYRDYARRRDAAQPVLERYDQDLPTVYDLGQRVLFWLPREAYETGLLQRPAEKQVGRTLEHVADPGPREISHAYAAALDDADVGTVVDAGELADRTTVDITATERRYYR